MSRRASHLPTHHERTVMQKMRALGQLPVREAASRTIVKMLAKGWIERDRSNEAFRVTAAGEAALKAQLPLSRANRPATEAT
jgi:hypothetical protein